MNVFEISIHCETDVDPPVIGLGKMSLLSDTTQPASIYMYLLPLHTSTHNYCFIPITREQFTGERPDKHQAFYTVTKSPKLCKRINTVMSSDYISFAGVIFAEFCTMMGHNKC